MARRDEGELAGLECSGCLLQVASVNDPGNEPAAPVRDLYLPQLRRGQWTEDHSVPTDPETVPRSVAAKRFDVQVRRPRLAREAREAPVDGSSLDPQIFEIVERSTR